jgi:superfamily II DNA or RNA helicase
VDIEPLFAEIREQASPAIWSKGVELSRRDAVTGDSLSEQEIQLRVLDRASQISAKVELYPEDLDWHSDCQCKADPCHHIAAAIIAIKRAREQGDELPSSKTAAAKLVYKFLRVGGAIILKRYASSEDSEQEIKRGLPLSRSPIEVSATKEDMAIDVMLSRQAMLDDSAIELSKILPYLKEQNELTLDQKPVAISLEEKGLVATITDEHGGGVRIKAKLDSEINETFSNDLVLCGNCIHPARKISLSQGEYTMLKQGKAFARSELAFLSSELIPKLRAQMDIVNHSINLPQIADHTAMSLSIETKKIGDHLQVTPFIVYGDPPLAKVTKDGFLPLGKTLPVRNKDKERTLCDKLHRQLGLELGETAIFQSDKAIAFTASLETWRGHLEGDGHLDFKLYGELEPSLSIIETNGSFDMQLDFSCQGNSGEASKQMAKAVDPKKLLKAWQDNASVVPLLDGGWAKLPADWLNRYGHTIKDILAAKEQHKSIPLSMASELVRVANEMQVSVPNYLAKVSKLLDGREDTTAQLPKRFEANLRPYQEKGFRWLSQLKNMRLGALLADDMGLGKTIQAITILEKQSLVVAPTSVIPNWQSEIKRFRPDLKVCVYHGSVRSLDESADVVLTSYGLMRSDFDSLSSRCWSVVVLDEAHIIKNPDSKVSKAAFHINARFKLALSGTPVENHLEDLWSLFRFLNPGLLGSRQHYKEAYITPIMKQSSDEHLRLQAKINPFFMRRLKRDVAPELPEKTEQILYVELSEHERQLYESIYAASKKDIMAKLNEGASVFDALEALLRMRQACCHPSLVPGQEHHSSAKIERLMESLEEAVEEGHKALIFSQWTSFLDIIGQALSEKQIGYLRLDGSTKDRKAVVDQFQSESSDEKPVLIMSLKAGGVGLNLSKADHVYIMDPWWNPFAEDQAADRAHRIGQKNPVIVHPLVALGTVEENIIALQQAKRALSQAATGDGMTSGGSELSKDELLALFER